MQGKITVAVLLAAVALLWPEIALRYRLLQTLAANDPAKLQKINVFKDKETKFKNVLKNCEDVLMVEEEGCAVLSCDPGRDGWNTVMGTFVDPKPAGKLFQWCYTNPDATPQPLVLEGFANAAQDFHPLGIEYHAPSGTLYVVNHQSAGPTIELFEYRPWNGFGRPVATHKRTLRHDLLWTPNSVAALSATQLLVTNDHYFRVRTHPLLAKAETYLALPGGSVVHVDLSDEDSVAVKTVATGIAFANGIAQLNASTVAVASTMRCSVLLYQLTRANDGSLALAFTEEYPANAFVDNISVDGNGALLVGGHLHLPSLKKVVADRIRCVALDAKKAAGEEWDESDWKDAADCAAVRERAAAPSWAAELVFDTEGKGSWRELFVGDEYGTSCGVARDVKEGVTIVAGLYESGVFLGKEQV